MEAPNTWGNGEGKELAVALANFTNPLDCKTFALLLLFLSRIVVCLPSKGGHATFSDGEKTKFVVRTNT